ncbi:MAG TPA: FAD-dependent oxidoreductase [Gaiellaceae bacterium]|jgi:3-phenylpropionate/trans-cinnamate dioxygenase ferredoxin reductase subunit
MIGIIGGGLAAAKVVESYREAGGTDEIVLWSQDPHGPYHRPPLTKRLLRGESKPEDALISLEGVDLRLGERIESLDDVQVDTIVLATGARPRPLGDALSFRTLDDSLDLRRRAESAKTATVIGGGFIGCEITASLTMIGVKVTQIVRDPMLFATIECPPLSEALHETYRAHGVDLRLETSDIPDADVIVAGIGVDPNIELAERASLEIRSGVVVDERFRTSRDGVYAVGDVAEFFDPLYGRHRRIEHWSTAAYHGTTLGKILAGDPDARYDTVSSFFSEEFGRSFRSFGDASGHDGTSLEGDFSGDHAIYRFLKAGATIAAVAIGLPDDEQDELKDQIRAGATTRA